MAKIWITDTEPHPRFTLYGRSNTGEVFPNVVTALTGSLIVDSIQRAQDEVCIEGGMLRPGEAGGPSVATGVFAGYLYLNLSTLRIFGIRMPGMSWRDIDEQAAGGLENMPPHEPAKGDRNLRATLTLVGQGATVLRRPELDHLDDARTSAKRWLATMPNLRESADAELLDWLKTYPSRQYESMKRLSLAAVAVGAPRGMLDEILRRAGADPGLANRIVSGTGDVDSAQPAKRLWKLARDVAGDTELTAVFDAGLEGIADRIRGTALQGGIDAFLADHGHRGNDEYELATPSWAMNPAPVYAAIDRLRHVPVSRDPSVAVARLEAEAQDALRQAEAIVARPLRRLLRHIASVCRLGSIGRERTKDILVLENLGARLVTHELIRRAAERGGPSDPLQAFCITADELADFVADPTKFADVIAERAKTAAYLNERVPPAWFKGVIPDPATWELRSEAAGAAPVPGDVLAGIGVSGGVASGRARVIADPADPRGLEPGEVLVCAITDPSWTPLFLSASAVVCDTGAIQSHAAIVARELGLPAVMSVIGITSVADGTMLHVDGDTGQVRVGDW